MTPTGARIVSAMRSVASLAPQPLTDCGFARSSLGSHRVRQVIFPPYWMTIIEYVIVLVRVLQRKFAAGISIGDEGALQRERR